MQCKLFVYQKDLFVRCEKNFQGEIAIRSRDIAINKKVPLECSEDHATHLNCHAYHLRQGKIYKGLKLHLASHRCD